MRNIELKKSLLTLVILSFITGCSDEFLKRKATSPDLMRKFIMMF